MRDEKERNSGLGDLYFVSAILAATASAMSNVNVGAVRGARWFNPQPTTYAHHGPAHADPRASWHDRGGSGSGAMGRIHGPTRSAMAR